MGHEYIGEVIEVGDDVKTVNPGDFVVGSFCISCGECATCQDGYPSRCLKAIAAGDGFIGMRSNGTQAEYARIPYRRADSSSDGGIRCAGNRLVCS